MGRRLVGAGLVGVVLLAAGCSSQPRPREPGASSPAHRSGGPRSSVRRPPAERPPGPVGVTAPVASPLAAAVVEAARSMLGRPYRYAGADRRGFDCSGLTWHVLDRAGVAMPRTAAEQAEVGRWVALDELAPGDLVFFATRRGKPHHVGLVVSEPGEPLTMIHAASSRGVVETDITADGYWLERLRFGRRVLPASG